MYTFNQSNHILSGNNIQVNFIDTAMSIIPFHACKHIQWRLDIYEADGYYLKECYDSNPNNHIYVDNDLCYYNHVRPTF